MKMARADENDLKAALDVSRIIEDLERGYMPGQDDEGVEFFDRDDADQCRRALAAILDAADQGSMFRVTFGMTVVLDPRNKVVDPDADTLEIHPDHERNAEDAARWRHIRRKLCLTGNGDGTCAMHAINLPAAIQGWPEPEQVAEFCDAAIDAALRANIGEKMP
ncbi:hypothetical protein [Xenophilus sp. Marseille-Q4582]|uniref:hypothetical protein n=1 Tax=Xenophilus sp. Marseille-Q4582 TaxID=2866600 RepID=UPI001CE4A2B5|nr:hypothetical protein [Xenophilus sp. Marseille-Q4582]